MRNKLKQKKKEVDLFNSWINYRKHFTRLLNMMQHKVQSIGNFSNTTPTQLGNHQECSLSTGDNHVRGWTINPPRVHFSAQLTHCCTRAPICAGQSHMGSDQETSGSAAFLQQQRPLLSGPDKWQPHTTPGRQKRSYTQNVPLWRVYHPLQLERDCSPLPWARGRI